MAFDARILTPIHVFGIVLVASLPAQLQGWPARATLVGLAALATLNVGRSLAEARSMANIGECYSTRYWRDSPTLAFARSLPPGALAYSNDSEAPAFFTACEARDVPSRASRASLLPRPSLAPLLACAAIVAILSSATLAEWRVEAVVLALASAAYRLGRRRAGAGVSDGSLARDRT